MIFCLLGSDIYRRRANLRAKIDAEIDIQAAKVQDTPPQD